MKRFLWLVVALLGVACRSQTSAPSPIVQTVVLPQAVVVTAAPAATVTSPSTSTTISTSVPYPAAAATQPRGLAAVNNFEPTTRVGSLFDNRTYVNPNVAGLTFRTSWADLEPAEGDIVWAKLDTIFDNAEKNGKWVD